MFSNFEDVTFEDAAFELNSDLVNADILESTLDIALDKPALISLPRRKLRVLALHGFGQSGDFFRTKTRRLTQYLESTISSELLDQHPDGIEWLFPDAPIQLTTAEQYNSTQDVDMRAWWRKLDWTIQLEELYQSLEYIVKYLREHGPVDGILGFSQGASMAAMVTALCEGSTRPERVAALANQGLPLLIPPPQAPFKFAVLCCGFKNEPRFYSGFFTPKINTPTMHVIAEWDHMVSSEMSSALIDSCEDAVVIRHRGSHNTPTDRNSLYEMARFVSNACAKASNVEKAFPSPTYALPDSPLHVAGTVPIPTQTVMTVTDITLDECATPALTESALSPVPSFTSSTTSSVSSYFGPKRRRLRFARRITVRRI